MKNSPSLGTNDPPGNFKKLKTFSLKIFWRLAKAVGILLENSPSLGTNIPLGIWLGIFSLWRSSGKAVGILLEKQPLPGDQRSPWEFQKVTSLKIFCLGMPTFLAGFCAPGGPLAKAVGILLEKQPLPGDQRSPWEFQKVTSLKIFCLGMPTFLAGFCAPGGPLAKAVGNFA